MDVKGISDTFIKQSPIVIESKILVPLKSKAKPPLTSMMQYFIWYIQSILKLTQSFKVEEPWVLHLLIQNGGYIS